MQSQKINLQYIRDINNVKEGEQILKYFLLVGNKNQELRKSSIEEIKKKHPTVLSSYSIEGNTKEFISLTSTTKSDPFYMHNIFPLKSTFFNTINLDQDLDEIDIKCDPYEGYIILADKEPNSFFHCVELKNWGDNSYVWFFNCLITFEKLRFDKEKRKNLWIPKAFIIVTHEPYFTLCKNILEKILEIYKKPLSLPLEVYILHFFSTIRKYSTETVMSFSDHIFYCYKPETPFLGAFDINFSLLFKMFTLHEILFIAENFVRNKNFLVISKFPEILYPLYHMIMTVVHPLGITDNTYFYKLLTPETIQFLFSGFPFMLFAYCDSVNEDQFDKIAMNIEADILVISIQDKKNLNNYVATMKLIKYIPVKGKQGSVYHQNIPKRSLFEMLIESYNNEDNKRDRKEKVDNKEKDTNQDKQLCFISTYLFLEQELKKLQLTEHYKSQGIFIRGDYELIRQLFFSFMVNFFISIISEIYFEVMNEEIHIELKINEESNKKYQIKDITSSPICDIIYKANILSNPNLKFIILRDEIIKLSQIDQSIVYFEFKIDLTKNSRNVLDFKDLSFLEDKIYLYLNKFNRSLQRQVSSPETQANPIEFSYYKDKQKFFYNYSETCFYFEIFSNSKNKDNLAKEKQINVLFIEIENYYTLYINDCIPIYSKKELASYTIGIALSFIILYGIRSKNVSDQDVIKKFRMLYGLFETSKGFNKRCNILLSLIFTIIISHEELFKTYRNLFISKLQEFKIVPTITIFLEYSQEENKILEKNEDSPILEYRIISLKKEEIKDKSISNFHKHSFHMDDDVNGDFICPECKDPYKILINDSKKENRLDFLISPKRILNHLLQYAKSNDFLYIKDINKVYEGWLDDLCQIAYFNQYYFKGQASIFNQEPINV